MFHAYVKPTKPRNTSAIGTWHSEYVASVLQLEKLQLQHPFSWQTPQSVNTHWQVHLPPMNPRVKTAGTNPTKAPRAPPANVPGTSSQITKKKEAKSNYSICIYFPANVRSRQYFTNWATTSQSSILVTVFSRLAEATSNFRFGWPIRHAMLLWMLPSLAFQVK